MLATTALDMLTGAGKDGISVDAQIGDRENTLGDHATVGDVEAKTVAIDQGGSSFKGTAETVTVNEIDWKLLLTTSILCFIFGWMAMPPKQIWEAWKPNG